MATTEDYILMERLLEYVKNNNREKIRHLLTENSEILNRSYEEYYKPILYISCYELADKVSGETVSTLIELGADLHFSDKNTKGKEAIHYAVMGNNPDILKAVVERMDDVGKINSTAQGSTALNYLLRNNKEDTVGFQRCLDILLKSGINVNMADRKNITPILWASYHGYKNAVTAILDCGRNVDVDTHIYGGKTARMYIEENNLYGKPLPSRTIDNGSYERFPLRCIEEYNEYGFLQLKDVNVDYEIEEGTLLQLACERNLVRVVERLLEKGANIQKRAIKHTDYPLQIAAKKGYHKIFKMLIERYSQNLPQDTLTLLLKYAINADRNENVDYDECLKVFLDHAGTACVNEYSDTGNTPLHYIGKLSDDTVALKLLELGASLANRNNFGSLPLENVDSEILEEYFDNCVTREHQVHQPESGEQDIIVSFNYRSFFPTNNDEIRLDVEPCALVDNPTLISETDVIYGMSKIPEIHHLLVHPLISSFIYIKWQKLILFFIINLTLFFVFCSFLVVYIFSPDRWWKFIVWVPLLLIYLALIIIEFIQIILSGRTYFRNSPHVLKIVILAISFYLIFFKSSSEVYKFFSSVTILLSGIMALVLLGQHPKMSTYIVMFRTVTKDFFKLLCWFSVLILAFMLCFHQLFKREPQEAVASNYDTDDTVQECDDKTEDPFANLWLSFIKTIAMLTGEFDTSSLPLQNVVEGFIFLSFVFSISIVLFNLLIGLAVSDVQMIMEKAEIMSLMETISHITHVENVMLSTSLFKFLERLTRHCSLFDYLLDFLKAKRLNMFLFPNHLDDKIIVVSLYRKGGNVHENIPLDEENSKRVMELLRKKMKNRSKSS